MEKKSFKKEMKYYGVLMKKLLVRLFGIVIIIFACINVSHAERSAARIWMDGNFSDWDGIPPLYDDESGDQQSGNIDFGLLKAANDERFVYLYIEIGDELNLQDLNEITLYLDTDNNASTGIPINGIGAEVKWVFGDRQGTYTARYTIYHQYIGLVTAPTVTSDRFEIAIDRTLSLFGQQLFPQNSFRIVFHDEGPGGDYLPDIGDIVSYNFDSTSLPPIAPVSLKKTPDADFRAMTYNVLSSNIFDPAYYDNFDRILSAIDPEIIAFEEIYDHTANDVKQLVESMLPSGTGEQWYCEGILYDDIYAVSRFPITQSFEINKSGAFLINLDSRVDSDLLFIVAHLSYGDYNTERQLEIDELMAFIRDAKEPGGSLTLEQFTPIIITGDLNLVGDAQQLQTLLTGEIVNPQFQPSFNPDWDGSNFGDLCPRLTRLQMFYTWYSTYSSFYPGRLDFMIYSDYVLSSEKKFVLFTPEMDSDSLAAYGLNADDVTTVSDHIPVVSDFKVLQPGSTSIYDIQHTIYPGADNTYPSPFNGQTVTTTGIVTAIGYNGASQHFFISSQEGGLWEGLYIYSADQAPDVGDIVEVTGEVYEYYGMTEIRYPSVTILSSGNPVPDPLVAHTGELIEPADAERYEDCLVKVEDVTVTQELNPDYEWYGDDGTGECQIDDKIYTYIPFLGEQFEYIIGVLDYSWDEYAINPRDVNDLLVYSVDDPPENVTRYQCHPNPFSDHTVLSYTTKNYFTNPQLTIYNILGQRVSELQAAEDQSENFHTYLFTWNGTSNEGTLLPNGIYFYSMNNLETNNYGRMVLLR